ncbi:MAG: hypothetical protein IPO40_21990 [Fibrobacteres bacterium]|nr:hypothetical protein [Fibrobacterota bacterium]
MKRLQSFSLALLAATVPFFQACDKTHVVAGGSDDTHSSLDIQGRVFTQDAKALPNVVVRLRQLGLADTTGPDGSFAFVRETGFDPARKDTLDYYRDGEQISSVAVPTSVWLVPDLYVVQRDFSGTISGNTSRIRHVVGQLRLPDGTLRTFEMDWNPSQQRYSGFAHFAKTETSDTFSIVVTAKDSLDRICGRSDSLRFSGRSGSVLLPAFDAQNKLPSLVLVAMGNLGDIELPSIDFSIENRRPYQAWAGQLVRLVARAEGMIEQIDHAEWSFDRSNWSSRNAKRILGTAWARWDTTIQARAPITPQDTQVVWVRLVLKNGLQIVDSTRIVPVTFKASASILVGFPDAYELLEGVPPGAPLDILLEDRTLPFTMVVSRTVTLGKIVPDYSRPDVQRFSLLGPVERVSGNDTILPAPSTAGTYAYIFQIEHANGTLVADTSSPFLVLNPGPRIQSTRIDGDSITVHWTDSVPSQAVTRLVFVSETDGFNWRKDTVTVPARKSSGSVRIPMGSRRLFLSIDHPMSFRQDTVFSIPFFTWTFSGASVDTSRLKAWGEAIGGFRAYTEGGIGQILMGEVAKLRWFREESTSLDGAKFHFQHQVAFWNEYEFPGSSDTLSLDIANPDAWPLVVEAAFFCEGPRVGVAPDTLRWTLAAGPAGRIDLPLANSGWPEFLQRKGARPPYFCSTVDLSITATQTTGPRARQGFLEIDNVHWH